MDKQKLYALTLLFFSVAVLHKAHAQDTPALNGYIEADLIYLSASTSGKLEQQSHHAGDHLKAGDVVFVLDADSQAIALQQAKAELAQAQAQLADLQTGARPDEIKSLQAQLAEAKASQKLSYDEKVRWSKLADQGKASQSQKDQKVEAWQVAKAKVANLEASLHLATLGAREAQIQAAEAAVQTAQAAVNQARWQLSQRTVLSPMDAQVEQVYQRIGEYVSASRPVLSVTQPQHRKAIFYVSESQLSRLQVGQNVQIRWDGGNKPLAAKVSFIAQNPEFTPPIIFSQGSRQKLVYKVEAQLTNSQLRPGQPIDVYLPAKS